MRTDNRRSTKVVEEGPPCRMVKFSSAGLKSGFRSGFECTVVDVDTAIKIPMSLATPEEITRVGGIIVSEDVLPPPPINGADVIISSLTTLQASGEEVLKTQARLMESDDNIRKDMAAVLARLDALERMVMQGKGDLNGDS